MKKFLKNFVLGLVISLVLPGMVSAHTIHFETLGNKQFPDIEVEDGGGVALHEYVPELEGYMFDQWTTNSDFSYSGGYESWPGNYYWNVSKDMTFYAYFYDRVYTFAYNKTTNQVDNFAGKIFEGDYECPDGYCTVLEPYNEEVKSLNLEAKANAGFKFVEWKVGYSMPAKTHIADGYEGVSYSETVSASTNSKYSDVGGKGFITLYAVFEEDENSSVELINEAHATVIEPKDGVAITKDSTSGDANKYSVTAECWTYKNSYNCLSGNFEDGKSYSISVLFEAKEGYRFGKNTIYYINDKKIDEKDIYGCDNESCRGEVTFKLNVEEPVYTVIYDYNGALKDGKSTETYSGVSFVLDISKDNLMQGVIAPSGKELDYLLINGMKYELNNKIEVHDNMTIKYIWKSINQEIKKPSVKISSNNNTLIINWDNQEVATKYEVYRSENNKKWKKIKSTTDNSYTDKGLTYNKKYYYKVRAYDGSKWSGYSNVVSKKVVPNKVKLSISSVGTNNVKLSWEKVSVNGYEVYMNGKKIATIKKNGTLTYNKTKLKANTTYKFKVRAYKTVKSKKVYGPFSSEIKIKTAPAKPSLTIKQVDYDKLNIKMGASKGAAYYLIQESEDGINYYEVFSVEKPVSGIFNEFEVGMVYKLRVKACNSQDYCSGWKTLTQKITTLAPKLKLTTSSKKVTVSVGKVNGADGYEIYRATSKKGKYTLIKTLLTEDEIYSFINKTKKGKTYYYKVRSYKIVNDKKIYSPYSSVKSIKSK